MRLCSSCAFSDTCKVENSPVGYFSRFATFYVKKFWKSNKKFQLCLSQNWFSGGLFVSSRSSSAVSVAGQSGVLASNNSLCFRAFVENYVFLFQMLKIYKLRLCPKVSFLKGYWWNRVHSVLILKFCTCYVWWVVYLLVPFIAEALQQLMNFRKISFLIFSRNFLEALFSDRFHLVLISKLSMRTFSQGQAFLIATSCSR